jgi:CHASE2 domain
MIRHRRTNSKASRRWKRFIPGRDFLLSAGWGMFIALALLVFDSAKPIEQKQNFVIDPIMRYEAGDPGPLPTNLYFIDLFDTSDRAPYYAMKRADLARTLRAIGIHPPGFIVIDLVLAGPDLAEPGADSSLIAALDLLPPTTKVIFSCQIGRYSHLPLPLIVDSLISAHPTRFFRAPSTFEGLGTDLIVRYIPKFSPAQEPSHALPTIPYLLRYLREGTAIDSNERGPLDRFRFLLYPAGLLTPEGHLSDSTRSINLPARLLDKVEEPKHWNHSTVVIIGQSNPDLADNHITPIGEMAGMYVLGNAINTLMTTNDKIVPVSSLWKVLMDLGSILLAAYLFTKFHHFWAELLAVATLLAILIPLTVNMYLGNGILLNPLLPIVAMFFHRVLEEIKEAWHHPQKQGT